MDYIAAGNVMTDVIIGKDETVYSGRNIGGPAFFALEGIRLFTESCKLVSNVGADFFDYYGKWFDDNKIERSGITIRTEHTSSHQLSYNEDGSYNNTSLFGSENLGYLKMRPDDLRPHLQGVKGVYLAQNNDNIFFDGLKKVKDEFGFKFMWEWEHMSCRHDPLDKVLANANKIDYFSINYNEMADLTGCKNEAEAIDILKKFPVEAIWFRVGKKGAYTIMNGEHFFLATPPAKAEIDPTGCGNSSTGAALYAFAEGYEPVMAGILANVMAGYNVSQYGPYPIITKADTAEAFEYARKLRAEYTGK